MQRKIRIFADDLTGAADTGVSLLRRGTAVALSLRTGAISGEVVDLDIRDAPDAVVRARLRKIASAPPSKDEIRILKIDSTLRGPVDRIIETALALRSSVVICPAFPETGRTVQGGRLLLHGIPVNETDFGRSQGLTERQTRLPGEPASPDDVARGRPGLLRIDAGSAADLDRIVRAVLAAKETPILIGSGGIARSVMRMMGKELPPPLPPLSGPVLWVAGSAAPILRAQIAQLGPLEAPEIAAPGAEACLAAPHRLNGAPFDPSFAEQIVARARAVSDRFGTIFVSGGTTARALLDALGLGQVTIVGEPVPGTVALATGCGAPCHILVRSGGFGSEGDLVALRASLGAPSSTAG